MTLQSALNGCSPSQLEPKCLFKVQYLNNHFLSLSVKFFTIMRRSSRKCCVVTDHEKLIALLYQKDRALRVAWDILNGVLRGLTQAEKKWVIPKNHVAYYFKKLKEKGVCIEMDVNASRREESAPEIFPYFKQSVKFFTIKI